MNGFFKKIGMGLAKTRDAIVQGLKTIFTGKAVNDEALERLSEVLIGADMGVAVTDRLIAFLRKSIEKREIADFGDLKEKLKQEIKALLNVVSSDKPLPPVEGARVTLFIGVNGVGKTTTIGKMAHRLRQEGKSVLLAAGDTFRAGAIAQLSIWGQRVGVDVIASSQNADPSAVAFDAVQAARARHMDHLLIDTAGRLQTNHNLMEELKKMVRVIAKVNPTAPHERILVLDAITGQNALSQAKLFHQAIGLTGMILTKMDTTARGGMVVAIADALQVPVLYVGMGEGMDDLFPFEIDAYVNALFEAPSL